MEYGKYDFARLAMDKMGIADKKDARSMTVDGDVDYEYEVPLKISPVKS